MKQKICSIDELSGTSCKEFKVKIDNNEKDAFLIYFNSRYYAFINSCPHTGVNLNWQDEQFFNYEGDHLQCSLHGALFSPLNGKCLYGPCLGQYLEALEVVVVDNIVYLSQ